MGAWPTQFVTFRRDAFEELLGSSNAIKLSIVFVIFVLFFWTWGKWIEPLIDFGRELYIPWQISEGKHLYRDLASFNGPISPYFNAFLFKVFGPGLNIIIFSNLIIFMLITFLLYKLSKSISDARTAAIACLVFVATLGFSQLGHVANFNFITPYSHEITHGLFLALASLAFTGQFLKTKKSVFLTVAGICIGLLFLTKFEIFAAGVVSVVLGLGIFFILTPAPARDRVRGASTFIVAVLAPIVIVAVLLGARIGLFEALDGIFSPVKYSSNSQVVQSPYYQWCTGFDRIGDNLIAMIAGLLRFLVLVVALGLFDLAISKSTELKRKRLLFVLFGTVQIALVLLLIRIPSIVQVTTRCLPLLMAGTFIFSALYCWKHRYVQASYQKAIGCMILTLFSLLLLSKILLHARTYHYGFVLSAPALVMVVILLFHWIPSLLPRVGARGSIFKLGSLPVLGVVIFLHLHTTSNWNSTKKVLTRSGKEAFYASKVGEAVNQTLIVVEQHIPKDKTFVVLPEGVMLNYLSRRASSIPHVTFMPVELLLFGESSILETLKKNPPDFIFLVHKDTSIYGPRFFGRDYGQSIFSWVKQNYEKIGQYGATPLESDKFGIQFLRRK